MKQLITSFNRRLGLHAAGQETTKAQALLIIYTNQQSSLMAELDW